MPSASVSLPGPEHSSRAWVRPRRRRIASRPRVGSSARMSTAAVRLDEQLERARRTLEALEAEGK